MNEQTPDGLFITGECVTVEAASNGFICHTENGAVLANGLNEVVGILAQTLLNSEMVQQIANQQQAQAAATEAAAEAETAD